MTMRGAEPADTIVMPRLDSSRPAGLTDDHRQILRALAYYQIFRFPLTLEETARFSGRRWDASGDLERRVGELAARGVVHRTDEFIHLGPADDVTDRRESEQRAARMLPRAIRRSRLIARFPFVRGVALSGTLSKGVFHRGDDIDFFVITAAGRLWICRTFLMAFKKAFLFNRRRRFCINYFITEDRLEIPDRNRFAATEIAWLRPTVNPRLFQAFFDANTWVKGFFPNWDAGAVSAAEIRHDRLSLMERWLGGRRGERLDHRCRRMIERHNRRKYPDIAENHCPVALRTEVHASKHHPRGFQRLVLDRYETLLAALEEQTGLALKEQP